MLRPGLKKSCRVDHQESWRQKTMKSKGSATKGQGACRGGEKRPRELEKGKHRTSGGVWEQEPQNPRFRVGEGSSSVDGRRGEEPSVARKKLKGKRKAHQSWESHGENDWRAHLTGMEKRDREPKSMERKGKMERKKKENLC